MVLRKVRSVVNKLLALRAEQGPYRFLVGRWDGLSDVDLAIRILGTDFFRSDLVPIPLPVDELESILVIAPHQDDEVIGAGGALLIASALGVDISVLYVTDGVQLVPIYSPNESARIRESEAREVCDRLGATDYQLGLSNPNPRATLRNLQRLSGLIHDIEPQVMMVPWLLDSPAKHRLTNHLLWLAHQRFTLPEFEVWGYQVHNTLYPNGYVDITEVANDKQSLLQVYRSQNEYFQRYDHLAMGLAAWNSRFLPVTQGEIRPRYAEVFLTLPLHEHLRLIERFYFSDIESTYRGHEDVIAGINPLHREVTGKPLSNM